MANITDVELDIRLQELAEGLGLSVYEFVTAGYVNLETYQLDIAAINNRLNAIDVFNESDGVETVVERLETLRNIFETASGDLITTVIADIASNKTAIASEKAAREAAVSAVETRVTTLETSATTLDNKIAAEKVARESADLIIDNKVQVVATDLTGVKARLDVIEGSETVEGSIKKAVKVEKDRSLAVSGDLSNLAAEFTGATRENLVAAINSLKASIVASTDHSSTSYDSLVTIISALQAELDKVESSIGLDSTGGFTPVDGADSVLEYIASLNGDADSVVKALKKLAKKAKEADAALDAKISVVDGKVAAEKSRAETAEAAEKLARETKDADLQAQINALSGGSSSSITDLTGRVSTLESAVNDVTDGQGVVTKGLKSKVADLQAAQAAEVVARDAAVAAGVAEAKAYADENYLGVPQIQNLDICAAVNKFRSKLFLAPKVCNGSTPVDNGGSQGGGL